MFDIFYDCFELLALLFDFVREVLFQVLQLVYLLVITQHAVRALVQGVFRLAVRVVGTLLWLLDVVLPEDLLNVSDLLVVLLDLLSELCDRVFLDLESLVQDEEQVALF